MATQTYRFSDLGAADDAAAILYTQLDSGKYRIGFGNIDGHAHQGYVVTNDQKQAVGYFEVDCRNEPATLKRIDIADIEPNSLQAKILASYARTDAGPAPLGQRRLFAVAFRDIAKEYGGQEVQEINK